VKTSKLLSWIALGGGAYLLYRAYQEHQASLPPDVPIKGEIPPGSRPTGRTTRTTNGNAPDDPTERLAYMIRDWVEILMPDGQVQWFEVDRSTEG
jgi:hypothetical protein